MDLPLLLSFQTILSDLSLLKMITTRYLQSPAFITLTDGTEIPCTIDRKSFFQCLGILLENGESNWLKSNAEELFNELETEPHTGTILPPFLLTVLHSVITDLAYFPFYALKTSHVSRSFRTPALRALVSSNISSGLSPCSSPITQILSLGSLREIYRGATSVCLLGLLRNYTSIQSRELITPPTSKSFTYTPSSTGVSRLKSFNAPHSGRPVLDRPQKLTTEGKQRASGNIFYDSSSDLISPSHHNPETSEARKISWYGRGMFAVLAHPLELMAVRGITREEGYENLGRSARRLWSLGFR